MQRLSVNTLIIGGGMAAGRLLQGLHARGFDAPVAVVSGEPEVGYNRVLLPRFLAGESNLADLSAPAPWAADPLYTVLSGRWVEKVNLQSGRAWLDGGGTVDFEQLVFATGSRVPVPEVPGCSLSGVTRLRSLADARQLRSLPAGTGTAVVVGGGLLGLEAADALLKMGLAVHVVHRGSYLMNRQLDAEGAQLLLQQLQARGMQFSLSAGLGTVHGSVRVTAAELTDGTVLPCELVVLATGVVPDDCLARQAGLPCADGVVVDGGMMASSPGVFAIGECARVNGSVYSLVTPVFSQADHLADLLSGVRSNAWTPPVISTRLKIDDLPLFVAGDVSAPDAMHNVNYVLRDTGCPVYRRLQCSGGRLTGAVLVGQVAAAARISSRMGCSVGAEEAEQLIFAA